MKSFLATAGVILAAAIARGGDSLTDQSASLIRLRDEIRKVLPPGWQADVTPNIPREILLDGRLGEGRLLVWYEQKAAGRGVVLNEGPSVDGPDADELKYQAIRPKIDLLLTDSMTLESHAKAIDENIAKARRRIDFRKRLREAGLHAHEPHEYGPTTAEQQELIRQYALLWVQTEPFKLPTHYYENLSFDAWFCNSMVHWKDPQLTDDIEGVEKAISRALKMYPTKPMPFD